MERCVSAPASKGEAEFMGQVNMVTGPELVAKHASPRTRGSRGACCTRTRRDRRGGATGACRTAPGRASRPWMGPAGLSCPPTGGVRGPEYPGAWAVDHFDNGGAS